MNDSRPRIEIQSVDGNSFEESESQSLSHSQYEDMKTQRSQFAPKIDLAVRRDFKRKDTSVFIKDLKDKGSNLTKSEYGGETTYKSVHEDPHDRKILYRVSKKIYSPEEVATIREFVFKNKMAQTKKIIHFVTSAIMVILILAMVGIL